jgi:hypothetical protein
MKVVSVVLEVLYDVAMVGLGSYGAYMLISEFVALERFLPISNVFSILRKRWFAFLALLIALTLFAIRIYIGLT